MVSCDDINPNVYKLYNYFSSIVFPFDNWKWQNSSILKLGQKFPDWLSMSFAFLFSKFVLCGFLVTIICLNLLWGNNKDVGFYTPDIKRQMVFFNGVILIPFLCCLLFVLSLANMSFTFSIILRIISVGFIVTNIISLDFVQKDSGNLTKKKFIDKVNLLNAFFILFFLVFNFFIVLTSRSDVPKIIKDTFLKMKTLFDVIYCYLKKVVTSNS
jgi:hypothetical protein